MNIPRGWAERRDAHRRGDRPAGGLPPDIGVEIRPSIREKHIQFGRDGFVIRYRRNEHEITVLRIFHSRQDRA